MAQKTLLPLDTSRDNMTLADEQAKENYKNGFACPTCNEELYDDVSEGILESCPAQKQVVCNCGFKGTRYVSNE